MRNHVNFQINLISPNLWKPNVILTCTGHMPYSSASGQKVILIKKGTDSPYTSFYHQGNGFLMIQMTQEYRFLPRDLPILCIKAVRFFIFVMSHTVNMHLFDVQYITTSTETSTSRQQARHRSVIPFICVGLFISNCQHFVHSAIHVSSSGKACMVKTIFISAASAYA